MSISEFFNKKARVLIATGALALGMVGGYTGHQIGEASVGAQPSNYTLNQTESLGDNVKIPDDQEYFPSRLPAGVTIAKATVTAEKYAVSAFKARIGAMAQVKAEGGDVTKLAVDFVNDLRLSNDVSERDYAKIVKDYNNRVGVDVTPVTGNWQQGVMYMQEARAAVEIFGSGLFGDDEDVTPQQKAQDVGAAMIEGQKLYDAAAPLRDAAAKKGAEEGALLGGLLLLPAWLGIRRKYPKVEQGAPAAQKTEAPPTP